MVVAKSESIGKYEANLLVVEVWTSHKKYCYFGALLMIAISDNYFKADVLSTTMILLHTRHVYFMHYGTLQLLCTVLTFNNNASILQTTAFL